MSVKAAEGVTIYRTDGNTGLMSVILTKSTDSGTVAAGNSATVVMDVITPTGYSPDYISISGVAIGDGSGTFTFDPATLPAGSHTLRFDIDVTESGKKDTWARGTIVTSKKRGT